MDNVRKFRRMVSCVSSKVAFCPFQSSGYHWGLVDVPHIREVWFKLVANSREVAVNGSWVNVWGLESYIVCKGLLSRFNIKPMNVTECDIWIWGRHVALVSGAINGQAQIYHKLRVQPVYCPSLLEWLPGYSCITYYFFTAPSKSQGGWRVWITRSGTRCCM